VLNHLIFLASDAMAKHYPIRRDKFIRTAEGYVELAMGLCDQFEPSPAIRNQLANRALGLLDHLAHDDERAGQIHLLRGQALRIMERYREAIPALVLAADQCPGNLHTWLALGWCYKRVGRLDHAIESLEHALAIEPDEALILYNLACYWSLARNPQLALEYLASALEIEPGYRDRISEEHDFDPIRKHPSFQELVSVVV
jgi:tetratricopeptide (TPR) repeat protein